MTCLAAALVLFASLARADAPVELPAATRTLGAVTLTFPAITYRAPVVGADPMATYAAALSSALGLRVDSRRDYVANAQNRILFRHPKDPNLLLKIYKIENKSPRIVAKLLQRDLAIADLLERLGVRHARLTDLPALRERGAVAQQLVAGQSLDRLHPTGYRAGSNRSVDRLLAALAPHDEAVRTLVGRQLGLTARNDPDCRTMRSLGFDLGHCYANVFVETATGEALLVDW